MAGDCSAACCELHNGVIVTGLIVDGLGSTAFRRDHLFRHPAFGIIVILDGIDDRLGGDDLTGDLDISFGSTDNSAFLVLIIVTLALGQINRPDNK